MTLLQLFVFFWEDVLFPVRFLLRQINLVFFWCVWLPAILPLLRFRHPSYSWVLLVFGSVCGSGWLSDDFFCVWLLILHRLPMRIPLPINQDHRFPKKITQHCNLLLYFHRTRNHLGNWFFGVKGASLRLWSFLELQESSFKVFHSVGLLLNQWLLILKPSVFQQLYCWLSSIVFIFRGKGPKLLFFRFTNKFYCKFVRESILLLNFDELSLKKRHPGIFEENDA